MQRPPRISTSNTRSGPSGPSVPSTPQAPSPPVAAGAGGSMERGGRPAPMLTQSSKHLVPPTPAGLSKSMVPPTPAGPSKTSSPATGSLVPPTPGPVGGAPSRQGSGMVPPTPSGGSKPTFSHRRISSFLQASGFKRNSNDVSAASAEGGAPNVPPTTRGAHQRNSSLWSPGVWSSLLHQAPPAGAAPANSESPQTRLEDGKMSNSSPATHMPDGASFRGVPPSNNSGAYGASGRLLHHLEPSPRVSKSSNMEYFGASGPGSEAPEQTQAQRAPVAGGGAAGAGPNPAAFKQGMMNAARINEFQKASGAKPMIGDGGEMEPNFMTKHSKPDPQGMTNLPSAFVIRAIVVINIGVSIAYLYWRVTKTITQIDDHFFGISWLPVVAWAWAFYVVECCLVFAIWVGHTQRLFPVQRCKVNMDDLVREDDSVGYNSRVCILLPTNGEKLDVVMKAMLGCVSLRGWDAAVEKCISQRVIILDEKRRKGVLNMAAAVYALATIVRHPNVLSILQAEGVQAITAKGFYDWWKIGGGYARKHLYNDHFLNQACRLLEYMEEQTTNEAMMSVFGLEELPTGVQGKHDSSRKSKKTTQATANHMLQALNVGAVTSIEPGYVQTFNTNVALPTFIYYTRRDPGTPKVSPKAGNMNAALFALDYPDMPPLIGNSTIVVVNDCRHQLQPEFLQRTVPYFFELDPDAQRYRWARVAFVQTPQRFSQDQQVLLEDDDPLGNHAAIQYDVINHGKDGIGAVSSSGQGSLWRVAALKGVDAFGNPYANPEDRSLVGHRLGFRSEMLIEDTHTSIDMFRAGWTSRYVNEPGEHLSVCTHQPTTIAWRIKQVLRWHQGAVQLLFFKGIAFTSFGGKFPTIFHRIYAFDQATYYLQAIPGYMLLVMPIIYGVTSFPPFSTNVGEFFLFFTPFIVTAMLPTAISGSWRGVDSHRLTRDEQVWLSTTYVQIYAFLSMLWQQINCRGQGDAWAVKCPTWPLFAVFAGEFGAIAGSLYWVSNKGFETWAANMICVIVSAALGIHALWPMVSLQMGWRVPSLYYLKLGAWLVIGFFIVVVYYISKD